MESDVGLSPVKLASGKKAVTLSAVECLICGKYAKKGTLRTPKECTNCEGKL